MLHAHPPSACRRISGVTEGGSSVEGFSKTYRSTGVNRDVLRSRPSLEKERVKNPRICVAVVQDSEKCEKMSRPRYGFLRLVNGRRPPALPPRRGFGGPPRPAKRRSQSVFRFELDMTTRLPLK